jgi:hypothetical protein
LDLKIGPQIAFLVQCMDLLRLLSKTRLHDGLKHCNTLEGAAFRFGMMQRIGRMQSDEKGEPVSVFVGVV